MMRRSFSLPRAAALAVAATTAAVTASGCGCGGPRPAKLVPVSGTVTVEGKPLGGAHVAFAPAPAEAPGTPGGDITGASGYYRAMHEGRAGLAPGKYFVRVSTHDADSAASSAAPAGDDPYMKLLSERSRSVDPKAATRIEATFERDVTADGGTLDFDLKRPAPEPEEPATKPGSKKKGKTAAKGKGSPLGQMYRN